MKNLRRSVAVILLLSTLFTLSACANTTIKNDDEVRLLWEKVDSGENITVIYYADNATNNPSHAVGLTRIKNDYLTNTIDLIRPLGEIPCEKLNESEVSKIFYNSSCLITFYIDDQCFSLRLYDGYLSINNKFFYKIDYDKNYIVEKLIEMSEKEAYND